MPEKTLADWSAFEDELQTLRANHTNPASPLLFRGQQDSEFRLTTTLERAGCEGMSFLDYCQLVNRIRPALETLTGANWESAQLTLQMEELLRNRELLSLRLFPPIDLYSYLVYLRHHGFPSPFLDWSHSPYVAAFFAFRDLGVRPHGGKPEQRSIYIYCEMPGGIKGGAVGEPTIRPIRPYVRSHPRHFRQHSDYT